MCPLPKCAFFFFPLKYLHKVSDSANYLKSVQYKNNVHKVMNCIRTDQGVDKAICHTPGLNIGSNQTPLVSHGTEESIRRNL